MAAFLAQEMCLQEQARDLARFKPIAACPSRASVSPTQISAAPKAQKDRLFRRQRRAGFSAGNTLRLQGVFASAKGCFSGSNLLSTEGRT
jgi:hypothetical protein